jgi:tRNA nucleotidyltransferase (CCA-adding enzyme)
MSAREHGTVVGALALSADAVVTLFERSDAFRKPERFAQMLLASECELRDPAYPQAPFLLRALAAARGVNAGEIAARHADDKPAIPVAVHAARVAAVEACAAAGRPDPVQ